jgi:hypothetical protein
MLPLERRKLIFGEQTDHLLGLVVFFNCSGPQGSLLKYEAGTLFAEAKAVIQKTWSIGILCRAR